MFTTLTKCIAIFVLLSVVCLPAFAQDTEACDLPAFSGDISEMAGKLTESDDPLGLLTEMASMISQARAECSGFVFTSEEEGLQPVLGPIEFTDGVWIATVKTERYATVQFTALEGDCDEQYVFSLMEGEANDGAQTPLELEGCSTLIGISNTDAPWELTFELVAER
ncbi:hypothetical protein G4Y79_20755 [Phototrophicus methaneseepsis]|uniref:Uncharacterized protein n=1 Tax=Phototrophicus methaneseepsis TaxID=2710758 RepID=A0A7S8E837_9CHLR|nr:hypothetical protein [Phototrophicus methaneseepsis]QPC82087.1 hypothetical protein G4Y79_20755 [Phototrophicus methaneseepsis]